MPWACAGSSVEKCWEPIVGLDLARFTYGLLARIIIVGDAKVFLARPWIRRRLAQGLLASG